jgi:hypothetical protein
MTTTQQCVVCMLAHGQVQGPTNHQTMVGMKVAQQRNEFRQRRYATQEPHEPPAVSMKLEGTMRGSTHNSSMHTAQSLPSRTTLPPLTCRHVHSATTSPNEPQPHQPRELVEHAEASYDAESRPLGLKISITCEPKGNRGGSTPWKQSHSPSSPSTPAHT